MSDLVAMQNGHDAQSLATTDPMEMLSRAVQSGASVETLEKLMALQERWEANNARKAFDAAMAAARQELPEIIKGRVVDFTSSKGRTHYRYEDLAIISETVSPILAKHGLSFRWRTSQEGDRVRVTCVVSHREGHSDETSLDAGQDHSGNKNPIQAIGSTVTYLQRYTLKAALGLAAGPDTDSVAPTKQEAEYNADPWLEKIAAMEPKTVQAVKAELEQEANKMPPQAFTVIKGAFAARIKRLKEMEAE